MSELISNKKKGNIDFNRKVIEYTCGADIHLINIQCWRGCALIMKTN